MISITDMVHRLRPVTSSFPRCVCCTTAGACSTPRPPAHRSATSDRNGVFSNHSSISAESDGDIYGSGVSSERAVQPSMPAPAPPVVTAVVTRRSAVAHEAGWLLVASQWLRQKCRRGSRSDQYQPDTISDRWGNVCNHQHTDIHVQLHKPAIHHHTPT